MGDNPSRSTQLLVVLQSPDCIDMMRSQLGGIARRHEQIVFLVHNEVATGLNQRHVFLSLSPPAPRTVSDKAVVIFLEYWEKQLADIHQALSNRGIQLSVVFSSGRLTDIIADHFRSTGVARLLVMTKERMWAVDN